jgi:hypothetical protein
MKPIVLAPGHKLPARLFSIPTVPVPGQTPVVTKRRLATNATLSSRATTPVVSQRKYEDQEMDAATGKTPRDQTDHGDQPTLVAGPFLRSPLLGLAATTLDDVEHVLIASQNRLRQLTDRSEHGFGLTFIHPDVMQLQNLVGQLETTYSDATKNLQRIMRGHPLYGWSKDIPGIGEKQFARLLAAIGDPYWNDAKEAPRTVSQLWAYCGYHVTDVLPDHLSHDAQAIVVGVAPARRRGERGNWSSEGRMRAYLIAESCIRWAHSPYRPVYDAAREKYAEAVHKVPCVRCGPSGHPAQVGSDLNPGHKHARAMRATAKAILKDLWIEARRLHDAGT